MTPSFRGRVVALLLVVCAGALEACGKKGPPLPPLARVPSPPANPQALRVGEDVYISFGVPTANVSGQAPADLSAIDLYAFTGSEAPPGPDPTDSAVRIGTYSVQPVVPPPPPPPEGASPPPPIPVPEGFAQGARAVVREQLTAEAMMPTPLPKRPGSVSGLDAGDDAEANLAKPLVASSEATGLKRFYFLVARGPRGRASTPTAMVSVPLQAASSPPADVRVEYTESVTTVKWSPSPDARVAATAPADPSLLPSKPLIPPPVATRYHVVETSREPVTALGPYGLTLPTTVTPQPVAGTELAIKGAPQYGVERCFIVRAVDTIAGAVTLGPPSEPGCVTATDTFPPAPPQRLAAIAGVGVINLIWEANAEPDLAGYIVLRGTAPGDVLQALTPAPIRETTYRDQSVRPGERYVYAVVAVDTAAPQNVSGQSNRVEESSRAPR